MLHIELVRCLEQHTVVVLDASCCGLQGPRRVLQGNVKFVYVGSFVFLPRNDLVRESEFCQHAAQHWCELRGEFFTVQLLCRIALEFVRGFTLHKQTLHAIKRRQFKMACGQRIHFGFDVEQTSDKVIEMRR